jgi:rRNA maturation RNase YbeY
MPKSAPVVYNRQKAARVSQPGLKKLLVRLLDVTGHAGKSVHLTLLGDEAMTELNLQTFGKNRTTNVISFPLGGVPGDPSALLGDVIVSVETARREAEKAGYSLEKRLAQLIIHGFLHILGYEHVNVTVAERRRMQRAEAKVYGQVADLVPGTLL